MVICPLAKLPQDTLVKLETEAERINCGSVTRYISVNVQLFASLTVNW